MDKDRNEPFPETLKRTIATDLIVGGSMMMLSTLCGVAYLIILKSCAYVLPEKTVPCSAPGDKLDSPVRPKGSLANSPDAG
ncbi:hypothetical protein KIN20_038223 [Parelaphostrongylus tenuis]|uniref:Uncharacterized protein n=1 Tax=Parelaphostrongylus tenuis TaxID=148309 RepID=A0AAD5RF60_PARTN|nr:hypothetical protein KIN20_038223 [Parelaphostrongylus tenuis]